MTLLDRLSELTQDAFARAGFDAEHARARFSDRPDLSQFQCNGAMAAAKRAGVKPRDIAETVVTALRSREDIVARADVAGPGFINFDVRREWLAEALAQAGARDGLSAWRSDDPETIVIDYGGPNVAKPLHVGHLRAAIIGEALKRMLRRAGHEVIGDVHLGDWGLQMGQLISELEARDPDLPYFQIGQAFPDAAPISLQDLEAMYPQAAAACKADKDRADRARRATRKLQDGDPGYRALWRSFVDLSVAAMRRDYDDLFVEFDLWKGESDVDPLIPDLEAALRDRGVLEDSDGAQIIRVERDDDKKEMPPIIFRNSEGAVGYHATDIATILDRRDAHRAERILYVVDARQRLHFEQVFRAADLADLFDEARLEHLWFGTMNGKDGKPFKTREGGTLKLRDLIDMVTARASERLAENDSADDARAEEEREPIARQVGVAALKFADLSNPRTSDYVFDLDRFLSFEGKTGPYLLYARVRILSVLERAKAAGVSPAESFAVSSPEEEALAIQLLSFDDAMRESVQKRMPHILCDHAFELAQRFSKFYASHRIVGEADETLQRARLALADAARRQLDYVLDILAIPAPNKM